MLQCCVQSKIACHKTGNVQAKPTKKNHEQSHWLMIDWQWSQSKARLWLVQCTPVLCAALFTLWCSQRFWLSSFRKGTTVRMISIIRRQCLPKLVFALPNGPLHTRTLMGIPRGTVPFVVALPATGRRVICTCLPGIPSQVQYCTLECFRSVTTVDQVDRMGDPERLGKDWCSFVVRALVSAGRRELRVTCLYEVYRTVQWISILIEGGNRIKILPILPRLTLAGTRLGIGLTVHTSCRTKAWQRDIALFQVPHFISSPNTLWRQVRLKRSSSKETSTWGNNSFCLNVHCWAVLFDKIIWMKLFFSFWMHSRNSSGRWWSRLLIVAAIILLVDSISEGDQMLHLKG